MNDVKVFDCPEFLTDNHNIVTHGISIPPYEDNEHNATVPLELKGVTSYFNTRKPTI